MFWSWFLLQILCQLCLNLKDFFKIVRLVLAAVSINGLNQNDVDKIVGRCLGAARKKGLRQAWRNRQPFQTHMM